MKKLFLIAFGLLFFASTVFAQSVSTNPALQALKRRLNTFTTLSAAFTQTVVGNKRSASQTSKGRMELRRPGQFIWKTTYPNQQTLIANGKTVWIYDADLEQATKEQLNTTSANSPAVFLTGDVSEVSKRFDVIEREKGNIFVLKARKKDDMFQQLTLHFKGGVLNRMDVLTKLEQKSIFRFSSIKVNPQFSKNYFNFKVPKGVEIIENRS